MKFLSVSMSSVLASGLLVAGAATANEPTVTIVNATQSDAASSRKVARDAATGRLRPTTEAEDEELAAAAQRKVDTGVQIVNRPNASVSRLPSGVAVAKRTAEDLEQLVAVQSSDGRVTVRHEEKKAPADTVTSGEVK